MRQERENDLSRPALPVRRRPVVVVVCAVLLIALGVRAVGLFDTPGPSLRFYRSAVIARAMYADDLVLSAQERRIAQLNEEREALLEPRIMETLSVTGYRIAGDEHLWIPRALAVLFWVLGGFFLFRIAAELCSTAVAAIAFGVYLLLPYGVQLSGSFQPDALMVCAMLAAIYAIVRYDLAPSRGRLVTAGAVAAFAVLVKPGIAAFFIAGAFLSLAIRRGGLREALSIRTLAFAALAAAPTIAYFAFNLGDLSEQGSSSWEPSLLLEPSFWRHWASGLASVLGGPEPDVWKVLGVLVGIAAVGGGLRLRGRAAALAVGLLAGYVVFGLVFNYHIATHSYYNLPLIPLVALCLGSAGEGLVEGIREGRFSPAWGVACVAGAAIYLALAIPAARKELNGPPQESIPGGSADAAAEQFEEIGDLVHHTDRAIMLDAGGGLALKYYGGLSGVAWYRPNEVSLLTEDRSSVREQLRSIESELGQPAEYFIVTDLGELDAEPDLGRYLESDAELVARTEEYVIYRL